MGNVPCPQCGSTRMHRSRRRGRLEHLVRSFGGRVRRCHDCNIRFLQVGGTLVRFRRIQDLAQSAGFAVFVALAMLMVLGVILWLGHRDASGPPEARLVPETYCGGNRHS